MSFAYKGMTHCKECGKALNMNEFGVCSYCKEKMNNKTNIEEDINTLKEKLDMLNKHILNYEKSDCKTAVYKELVEEAKAIENILADRERLQVKANKYDSLVEKIKDKKEELEKYIIDEEERTFGRCVIIGEDRTIKYLQELLDEVER